MHDAYTIGIPVLVILFANFINRGDIQELRAETNARFDQLETHMERHFSEMERRFSEIGCRFAAIAAELR